MSGSATHPTQDVLDDISQAADEHARLSLGKVMDIVGQHSFAPLLLLVGLIMVVPGPADIPGVPVLLGLLVIIIAGQLVMHRKHLWIPKWLERREVKAERARKMVSWVRKPAQWMDRVTKPRFQWIINHAGTSLIAIACILIAMTTPLLEFVPFSANVAGAAIIAFALALMAKDGVMAGLAIALSLGAVGLVVYQLWGN